MKYLNFITKIFNNSLEWIYTQIYNIFYSKRDNVEINCENEGDWIFLYSNIDKFVELLEKDKDCWVKYDNGEINKYSDSSTHHSMMVTHFKPL